MTTRRSFIRTSAIAAAYLALFGLDAPVRADAPGLEDRAEWLREKLASGALGPQERSATLLRLAREYNRKAMFRDEAATLKSAMDLGRLQGFADRFARFNYGKALYRTRDHETALLVLESLADEPFKYRSEALLYAARAGLACKDWKKTEALLARSLQDYPGGKSGIQAPFLMGTLELRRGRSRQAVAWFQKAVDAAEVGRAAGPSSAKQPAVVGRAAGPSEAIPLYLGLVESLVRSGDMKQAAVVVEGLLKRAGTTPALEMDARYRVARVYWGEAKAREVVELLKPVAGLWNAAIVGRAAGPSTKQRPSADPNDQKRGAFSDGPAARPTIVGPKALTLAGNAWRALGDRKEALACFATARRLASGGSKLLSGEEELASQVVLPIKAQAEMALQDGDDQLLASTLSTGEDVAQNSTDIRELYNVEVGKSLR